MESLEILREHRLIKQIEMMNKFIDCYNNVPEQDRVHFLNRVTSLTESPLPCLTEFKEQSNPVQSEESKSATTEYPQMNHIGPYIHVYDGKDITKLLYVFNNYTEATSAIPVATTSGIKENAKLNRKYLGYRWLIVHKHDPNPRAPKQIAPTDESKIRMEEIAVLNEAKTEVLKVFKRKKHAYESIRVASSTLTKAMENESPLGNCYWYYWHDLSQELKTKYKHLLEDHPKANHHNSVSIEKYDLNTNQVIETFSSMTEACKKYGIHINTMKNIIDKKLPCKNGFKWRFSNH